MRTALVYALEALGLLGIVAVALSVGMAGTSIRPSDSPATAQYATSTPSPGGPQPTDCTATTGMVRTAGELQGALDTAVPGTVIHLAPGVYLGNFTARASATADKPIIVCGSADSILDGGGITRGYVFHLDGASFWILRGFTIRNGQKGVMADATIGTTIEGLDVHTIGDEAIHLRRNSTDNRITGNRIHDTGLYKPKFGEGIYIGTAQSNWCDVTNCQPDHSDRNTITKNDISATTAESVDIKEGTSGGQLSGNTFDGQSMVSAEAWVNVKGNSWMIDGNAGTNSPKDGFQTHQVLNGWGRKNVFRNNTAAVNGPGVGYSLTPVLDNTLECGNTASGARGGRSNTSCAPA